MTRLATLPLLIDITVAILSTKLPILFGHGYGPFALPQVSRYGFVRPLSRCKHFALLVAFSIATGCATTSGTTTTTLQGVAFGAGTFVAVGESGAILTSPDGQSGTEQSSDVSFILNAVTYGNNRFLVVGTGGMDLTSNDGQDWNAVSLLTAAALQGTSFGNDTS